MINFTKTEWCIIESMKRWPKCAYELEECIDPNKSFSKDYISVMINNINKKAWRKIVIWKSVDWEYKYMLVEDSIEYKILDSVESTYEWLETVKKIACESCSYKANIHWNMKLNILITIIFFIFWIVIWFLTWFNLTKPVIEASIDCNELGRFLYSWTWK